MARILGGIASGLTIAALFRTSFEAFDIIQTSRNQHGDFRRLRLRLDVEKCRLYNWGESMGLTDIMVESREDSDDALRFPQSVRSILENLFRLFQDSEKLKDKYGCRQSTTQDLPLGYRQSPAVAPNEPELPRVTRIKQNITWVIHDRKKFTLLVDEITELIDKLKEVTSPAVVLAAADGIAAQKIKNIHDTEALALVAGVCSMDHFDITRLRQQRLIPYAWRQASAEAESNKDVPPSPALRRTRYEMAKL